MPERVDLHCHILPGVDDGAETLSDTRKLLAAERKSGVERFVFTPHFYPAHDAPEAFLARRAEAAAQLRALPEAEGIEFRLGAEIAFTPFFERLPLRRLAFGDSRYFLVELDTRYARPGVDEAIDWAVSEGFTPILAHVERYPYVAQDPTLLYRWVKAGALVQMNAGYVLRGGRRRALQYAKWGMLHLLASDAHHPEYRPPNLSEGYDSLPGALAEQLISYAEAVFFDRPINCPEPIRPERHWGKWR